MAGIWAEFSARAGRLADRFGGRPEATVPRQRDRDVADFLEEAGVVESESNRPPMGYRLKDRSAPVLFPRTFSPRHKEPSR